MKRSNRNQADLRRTQEPRVDAEVWGDVFTSSRGLCLKASRGAGVGER